MVDAMQECIKCPQCNGARLNPDYPMRCICDEPTWSRIDPEDESTWPAEASHIWLGLPLAMTSLHYWLRKDAAEFDGFYHKPANIPDPPEDTG